MKTRIGFVSNSSTSSFLAIGVKRPCDKKKKNYFQILADLLGYDPRNDDHFLRYGELQIGDFTLYGSDEAYIVGIDASQYIYTMNGRELAMLFKKKVKEQFNIDIPEDAISLEFGEVGSG